jgi:hypothetical protein
MTTVGAVAMAVGSIIVCPNCRNEFSRKLREHYCSDACRFWHKVKRASPDECWLWLGAKIAFGHGQFRTNAGTQYAHRHSWEMQHGPVPGDLCVLHRCDVPACVNPAHLFLGTREENLADMRRKKRGCNPPRKIGAAHNMAKLGPDEVRAIRASGRSQLELAEQYGVSRRHINSIINRRIWKHI